MKTYRDLNAWRLSVDLVVEVYRITQRFPDEERFGLVSQMRRSATSIPANIAEGQGRMTRGEWRQFLGHARGSLYWLETHLEVAARLGFVHIDDCASMKRSVGNVARTLSGLIRFVSN